MKNRKYFASFIIVLSLMFGYVTYAEEGNVDPTSDNSRETRDGFMQRKEKPELKNDMKVKRDEMKDKVKEMEGDFKDLREQEKDELKSMVDQVQAKRQEFKKELDTKKEEMKTKVAEMKANLKQDLTKIKDEKKKISTEKIVDIIQRLNTKLTDSLSEKVNQIENVLVSIESRITKAESNGLDVSKAKTAAEGAKVAITKAREAIKVQSGKVYTLNVTNETTLKNEVKNLRDTFKKDIEAVKQTVKAAHVAVRDTAVTLARIQGVDDVTSDDANKPEVEDSNTNKQ